MISGGVKFRLAAFLVLSAVGIVYVAGNYLGFVDAILGRGYSVQARLPGSGGLYEGSAVTYRGVSVGEVSRMTVLENGVMVGVRMDQNTKIPQDSPIYVHNGSAVGEQYLDFEPPDDNGPYAEEGYVFTAGKDTLPTAEEDLLVDLDKFVSSVNRNDLRTTIKEVGLMFRDTGRPLQRMIDSGSQFIDEASASKDATIRLLEDSNTVLATQKKQGDNIRLFADGLAKVTATIARKDPELRTTLQGGSGAARELDDLLTSLEPTLPVLLSNLVTVGQVTQVRLSALEQTLVLLPVTIAGGFTGSTPDGYGHVNLQFDQEPPACTKGYLPPNRWRPGYVTTDGKIYKQARCASGPPYNMRGNKYAPRYPDPGRSNRVAPYDPRTGAVGKGAGAGGMTLGGQGGQRQIFGEDSWKWMLIGPLERR